MDWFKLGGRNPCREESGSVSNCFSQCLAASLGWWLIKPVDPLDLWVAELQGCVMEREISCSSREDLLRPTKKQRPDVPTWMICDLKAIFKGYVGVSLSSLRTCSFFADRPYQIPVPPKHFKSYGAVLKYMSGKHQMFFFSILQNLICTRSAMEQCVPGGPVVEECEPPEIVCWKKHLRLSMIWEELEMGDV